MCPGPLSPTHGVLGALIPMFGTASARSKSSRSRHHRRRSLRLRMSSCSGVDHRVLGEEDSRGGNRSERTGLPATPLLSDFCDSSSSPKTHNVENTTYDLDHGSHGCADRTAGYGATAITTYALQSIVPRQLCQGLQSIVLGPLCQAPQSRLPVVLRPPWTGREGEGVLCLAVAYRESSVC